MNLIPFDTGQCRPTKIASGVLFLASILVSSSCDSRSSRAALADPQKPAIARDGTPVSDEESPVIPEAVRPVAPGVPPDHQAAPVPVKPHKKYPANRLAKETSPYLLLHAHNPVQWYPWGAEALAKAKKENKLIFLSIGYSSCYWCHVMERKCFMNEEIAAVLNKHYVCIKVDREERPDIDEIYMTALHARGEQGGWPLSMFLTPDAKPVIGGTYFPPHDDLRIGRRGFLPILKETQALWTQSPKKILAEGENVTAAVKRMLQRRPGAETIQLHREMVDIAQEHLTGLYDPINGGFGRGRTKFPNPSNLLFFLDRAQRGNEDAKKMLLHTLDKMAQGGIRDHLGGGFHRYSVDPFWCIPHFEKMLYDNGQLATLYAEGYALTQKPAYRRVVEQTLEFVLRELTDEQGGFYSALDAETGAVEGKYYIWSRKELQQRLDQDQYALFAAVYGIDKLPNFEERQAYVPQLASNLAAIAKQRKTTEAELEKQLAPIRAKLKAVRDRRKRPLTDTKILASWNGMMIRGFADAGRILEQPRYIKAAVRAADFAWNHLRKQGRLMRTSTAGETKINGYLEDYALLTEGLIALHRATDDSRFLTRADELMQKQIELFWDDKEGGFYFTSKDHEKLLVRRKDAADNVVPAGNSVSSANLLYLAEALNKPTYRQRATQTLQSLAMFLERNPGAVPRSAIALSVIDLPKRKILPFQDSTP